jgi:hypothetical protein
MEEHVVMAPDFYHEQCVLVQVFTHPNLRYHSYKFL